MYKWCTNINVKEEFFAPSSMLYDIISTFACCVCMLKDMWLHKIDAYLISVFQGLIAKKYD